MAAGFAFSHSEVRTGLHRCARRWSAASMQIPRGDAAEQQRNRLAAVSEETIDKDAPSAHRSQVSSNYIRVLYVFYLNLEKARLIQLFRALQMSVDVSCEVKKVQQAIFVDFAFCRRSRYSHMANGKY
jgi:hypothetical protein